MNACPRNGDIDELEVSGSQVLASDAVAGAAGIPCLWLRGLVPRSLTAVTSPCPGKRKITYLGGVLGGPWPGGVYWTGGSGVKFPDMPCMKRVYRDKRASVHWSAARNKERFSSRG